MKYIFDFDDVLFHNTSKLKPHMYKLISAAGISEEEARDHYDRIRTEFAEGFKMKSFIDSLFNSKNRHNVDTEKLHEDIMGISKNLLNEELIKFIRDKGKQNCFIVTHGNTEYQLEKINRVGIADLFSEIIVVQGSKKEAVEKICERYADETVFFIDDKEYHLKNLDFKKYPNLKTILYAGQTQKELDFNINLS